MNQDIIDYLDGYWELHQEDFGGICKDHYCYSSSFEGKGYLEYHPKTNILYIWSGLGFGDSYGYEVEIQDLQHLITLEALL